MAILTTALVLPSELKPSFSQHQISLFVSRRRLRKSHPAFPVARLFGPAIFEASKLEVLFLGVDEKNHQGKLPRIYTLTHSDMTSKLTLAISQTQLQGWYNRLQRDEVVAEWKKVEDQMSLHVHCHVSGGHFLLDLCAELRYFIFCKELPVVLKAFVHGDSNLFNNYPELQEALVWVYFHSNLPEFNRVECWGPLNNAAAPPPAAAAGGGGGGVEGQPNMRQVEPSRPEEPCIENCTCCFPSMSLIPWSQDLAHENTHDTQKRLQQQI
ncbi:protein STAY-GREEN homolog, chloroplastic-like isoform X2 [Vitis riparia]|uniref:protein STAY-GREEN homolog, chloroplastic-like isoform X2 n=1 Tax=Vitis riparia TaxID=96939 RepID=UPI00155A867D|nr:protein STAY-GREEN homolog, chloroplastic-like isoform X2 [Vitis riparia]